MWSECLICHWCQKDLTFSSVSKNSSELDLATSLKSTLIKRYPAGATFFLPLAFLMNFQQWKSLAKNRRWANKQRCDHVFWGGIIRNAPVYRAGEATVLMRHPPPHNETTKMSFHWLCFSQRLIGVHVRLFTKMYVSASSQWERGEEKNCVFILSAKYYWER